MTSSTVCASRNYQIDPLTDKEADRYKLYGVVYIITGLGIVGLNVAFIVIYKYSMYGNNLPIGAGVYGGFLGCVSLFAGFSKKSVVAKSVMFMNIALFFLSLGTIGICAGHLAPHFYIWKNVPTALGMFGGMIGGSILNIVLGVYVMVSSRSILKSKQHIIQGPVTMQNMQIPQGFNTYAPPPPGYTGYAPTGNIAMGNMAPPPPGYDGYQRSPGHQPPNYSTQADFGMGTKY